jgi:RNA polymerase sigma factor (sigma-70 family)
MDDQQFLARRFEEHRAHLRAVAYRMLGSLTEADDAVQEAWLRLSRSDADTIENLGGWLTTVVSRVCLNLLRTRTTRREDLLDPHVPDPIVTVEGPLDPEEEAMLADAVGVALLVVLETLTPAERLAFVLHDTFAVPFDQVAAVLGRSPEATRQLASRARRRVRGATATPDADVGTQRAVVDAFFAAARAGDFEGLVALLDPDVVARSDGGRRRAGVSSVTTGAAAVAGQALTYANPAADLRPALVNGAAGVVVTIRGRPVTIMGFTVVDGRIVAINSLVDPDRIAELDLAAFSA